MHLVKYRNKKTNAEEYRRYTNYDLVQIRKIIYNYSRSHGLIFVSMQKEW